LQKITVLGIVIGFTCIIITIVLGGTVGAFLHLPSAFVVLGGTIAATMVAYPVKSLKLVLKAAKKAFQKNNLDLHDDIELVVKIANIARREGLLALEGELEQIENPFLKKGIMLIADGADTELIKSIMQTEIYFLQERHTQSQTVLNSMSSYAPAFGMVGTLIGLINMLQGLDDPDSLGPGMSTALITTFYGVILANLVFGPIAKKLKAQSEGETLQKELIMEGILSIQDGENPRIIRDKLMSFIARSDVKVEKSAKKEVIETNEVQDEE